MKTAKNKDMDQELKQQFEKFDQRFKSIDSRLNKMQNFMFEHLVTKQELSDLTSCVVKLEETVSRLIDSVDKLTIAVNKVVEDHTVLKHQVMVIQDWIREASKKIGIEFKL